MRSTLTAHLLASGIIDLKVRRQTAFHGHKLRNHIQHKLVREYAELVTDAINNEFEEDQLGSIFSQFNIIGFWKIEVSERSPFACPARELQMIVRRRKSEFAGQTLILSAHI